MKKWHECCENDVKTWYWKVLGTLNKYKKELAEVLTSGACGDSHEVKTKERNDNRNMQMNQEAPVNTSTKTALSQFFS